MFALDQNLLLPDGSPSPQLLAALLSAQEELCRKRLNRLHEEYAVRPSILGRTRGFGLPNNRLAHHYPGYIVSVASGYLVGSPVKYSLADQPDALQPIRDAMDRSDCASVDSELAVDAAIYGKGIELCYADGQAQPRTAQIDPRRSFVVYDDTVAHVPLFGVTSHDVLNARLVKQHEVVDVYTAAEHIAYQRTTPSALTESSREPHYFAAVPMIEYWNNAQETGDFEPVLSLIDAYNTLQSDRLNDKQQFTDAIMVLKGVGSLGAEDAETDETPATQEGGTLVRPEQPISETSLTPSERLRLTKTLFLPGDGADAGFITKPDAESGNELLRQSLSDDIHKFSFVPDLTNEKFSGDTSGVAMRFKLLGLEQLTKIKERWFREGLRHRLLCLAQFLATKGKAAVDVDAVQITFNRSLPVNDLEIAQTAQAYDGLVPRELLLQHIPWVDDPRAAMEMLDDEKATFGLGTYDETSNTLEADFNVTGKEYALRCVVDTVDNLPYYFNYRVFELTGIKFDNFATKKDSVTVCEVIITGVFKRPRLTTLKPWAVMQLKDDRSNEAACVAYLTAAETKPAQAG